MERMFRLVYTVIKGVLTGSYVLLGDLHVGRSVRKVRTSKDPHETLGDRRFTAESPPKPLPQSSFIPVELAAG